MARLLLHGRIDNIQTSWVKLGVDGCRAVLQGGVNDLGGTLMEETISRMAGSQHGSAKTVADLEAIAASAGRPARQRTTLYGEVSQERIDGRPARRKVGAAAHCWLTSSLGQTTLSVSVGSSARRSSGSLVTTPVLDLRGLGVRIAPWANAVPGTITRSPVGGGGTLPLRVGCCDVS